MIRRLSCENIWNLHWRNCDKCGEKTLSRYSPEQKIIVYCSSCWWGDSWDGTEYATGYDSNRPFLNQIKELSDKVPHMALSSSYLTLKNCNYSNDIGWSKDCYLVFWADYCDNVFYSSILNGLKYSSDCIRGWKSELCYGSRSFIRGYKVFFSEECDDCVDTWFSRNCYGCTNCFGCVNLRGEKNCIFNVKYSKEEYEKRIKEFGLDSWDNIQKLEKQAREFWLTKPYREYHGHSLNLNVTGEYVYTSKNSKESYILNGAENCKWCQLITVDGSRDCMDYSGWGNNVSQIYESASIGENCDSVYFSRVCYPDCINVQYCSRAISGKNNLGCVGLKRKSYCILNKKYEKEEYEILKEKIIKDMKENPYIDKLGRKFYYGEFFPLELGNFPYNKSTAMRFFPKTKEQAIAEGYSWDDIENPTYQATIKTESIPDKIIDTTDSILNEVLECMSCGRGYRIVKGEFDLLRKMNLPLPHECPKCRENERFARENKPGMYHRNCAKCSGAIYTPYAPERPEIVYCVKCYQQEFI
jgi:hypothetical protein